MTDPGPGDTFGMAFVSAICGPVGTTGRFISRQPTNAPATRHAAAAHAHADRNRAGWITRPVRAGSGGSAVRGSAAGAGRRIGPAASRSPSGPAGAASPDGTADGT